ncbi:helix-turn-helix domain-containing protein [Mycolicibacterium agri]|uniref:helix-turn-helix domain-containing protein n=1 Tax=Mycolicibacterium agri TaxID=36811 RepID=UPI001C65CB51|nr:helix-turn-helix domain-containing protein [Mycolicibacterium agri]
MEVVVYLKAYPWIMRQFWDRVRDGMSAGEAGLAVGVSVHSGRRWFADAGGVRPKFLDEGPRKRPRLTLGERVVIDVGVRMGRSIRKIAEEGAPSTVMREIERNAFCYGRYRQRYRFGAPKKGGRDAKPRYRAAGAGACPAARADLSRASWRSMRGCMMRCRRGYWRSTVRSRSLDGYSWIWACQMVCVAVAPDEWSTICGCDR